MLNGLEKSVYLDRRREIGGILAALIRRVSRQITAALDLLHYPISDAATT